MLLKKKQILVLILVVVEIGLGEFNKMKPIILGRVLILVVVEIGLGAST